MSQRALGAFRGFVVEVRDRPILALSAASLGQARKLCSQEWFVEELQNYRSQGTQLWDGMTPLTVRCAQLPELAELEISRMKDRVESIEEEIFFSFLVPLDSEVH